MTVELTAAEIADTRMIVTDVETTNPVLTDEQIQALWLKSSDNLYVLYILCLQRIQGVYAQKLTLSDDFGDNRQLGSLFNNAVKLLNHYSEELAKTGYAVLNGVLTPIDNDSATQGVYSVNLYIDVEDENDETGVYGW